ncbi:TetR/AcrR family transcriptional regulator [Risungbinella massiliensis]|uniref:TetR/AcrR family transcriptional regulator n=1 Tax=Risungbinella massiliensis TaxID=1329796 RepID=UPI00069BF3E0|nr:TetR/AcrR family transcriptional regulator [Risungbinella massiliensis]
MTDLTPRARAKRDHIRNTAKQLFLQNGFSATSMDAITTEAKVSKQTLYSYYASKEDLLVDVLKQLILHFSHGELLEVEDISLRSLDELEQILQNIAHKLVHNLMQPEYLALVRVIISEITRLPKLGALIRSTIPERILGSIATLLERAQAQRVVNVEDTEIAARMFVGPLLTFVLMDGLLMADHTPTPPNEEQIHQIVRRYMKTLR